MRRIKVLEVEQPLGTFYVLKISAYDLLQLVESNPYSSTYSDDGEYIETGGVQRRFDPKRKKR
ncbi:hypothetical protein QNH98_02030 [Myroides sp. mNGS23_01]|nr:hypothetical protein [Myroides sp. mNGS23_01]WHT39503.1 hypothetical protein QNH98_02030 [Myroides sp. mNGS23_01]